MVSYSITTQANQSGRPAAAFLLPVSDAVLAAGGEAAFVDAIEAYGARDFSLAQIRLQQAAREGHWQSDELLGFMYAIGPQLFPGVEYSRERAVGHLESAAAKGSASSAYLLCALGREVDNAPMQHRACDPKAPNGNRMAGLGGVPYESD